MPVPLRTLLVLSLFGLAAACSDPDPADAPCDAGCPDAGREACDGGCPGPTDACKGRRCLDAGPACVGGRCPDAGPVCDGGACADAGPVCDGGACPDAGPVCDGGACADAGAGCQGGACPDGGAACGPARPCPDDALSATYCDGGVVRDRTRYACVEGACVETTVAEVVETCPARAFCVQGGCTDRPVILHDRQLPADRPLRILFVGNSFTAGGPLPTQVAELAVSAGWPRPETTLRAVGGFPLEGHRTHPDTLTAVDRGGWDVVVLQEESLRTTDDLGEPERFKQDAAWFYGRIKASSPGALVILFETWARHPDHEVYPDPFADFAEMQAQVRFHYDDAALRYVPAHAPGFAGDLFVSPVGDAWERHLSGPDPLTLHDDDLWHAANPGLYLNALVMYQAIYRCATAGLSPWPISWDEGARLQADADGLLGAPPCAPRPPRFPVGARVRVDLGSDASQTDAPGWNDLVDCFGGRIEHLRTTDGTDTSAMLQVLERFHGVNDEGVVENALGLPGTATRDSCFSGSAASHAAGLVEPGLVSLSNLPTEGRYTLRLFASRVGVDAGRDRLVRFRVGGAYADLEATDNADAWAVIEGLVPSDHGTLQLEVGPSPAGNGRFGYLGVLELERTR